MCHVYELCLLYLYISTERRVSCICRQENNEYLSTYEKYVGSPARNISVQLVLVAHLQLAARQNICTGRGIVQRQWGVSRVQLFGGAHGSKLLYVQSITKGCRLALLCSVKKIKIQLLYDGLIQKIRRLMFGWSDRIKSLTVARCTVYFSRMSQGDSHGCGRAL